MADAPARRLPTLGTDDAPSVTAFLNTQLWDGYTELRRPWLRQVEENVRNLAGRQFDTYVPELDEVIDLSQVYLPGDDRWRRAPVFNWLGQHWFMLHLAKLTENIPLLGAMPASGDQTDAQTAALFDPFFRYQWSQMQLPELQFQLQGWKLAAGQSVLFLRWDPAKGDPRDFYSASSLPAGPGQPHSDSPWLTENPGEGSAMRRERLGDFTADVLAPTSVLIPYGPWPHWAAPWIMREYLLHVEDARERFGMPDLEPDGPALGDGMLQRMEYSSYYGNSGSPGSSFLGALGGGTVLKDMVRIRERWGRETPTEPYGRLTAVTRSALLFDDINPYVIPGEREKVILPFYVFKRPGYPFRQEGVSDCESLNPIVRAVNRAMAGALDFADLTEQPPLFYNRNAGMADDDVERIGSPGARIGVDGDPAAAAAFLRMQGVPPAIGDTLGLLREWLDTLGHAGGGAEGKAVTGDASGELQREVRFDADRTDGATLRLDSYEWARFGQGLLDMAAVCMEDTRILAIAGEDQALAFVTVRPELFLGRVNIYPLPESMVLETRADKQMRLTQTLMTASQLAAVNPPMASVYLKQLGYPHLQGVLTPGGEAERLAERQIAEMLLSGQMAPVLPEQDHAGHIAATTRYMQTLAYRDQPEPIKQVLRTYRLLHEIAGAQQAVGQAQKQGMMTGALSEATGMPDPRAVAGAEAEQAMAGPEKPGGRKLALAK